MKHTFSSFQRFMQSFAVIIYINVFGLLPILFIVWGPLILFKLNSIGLLVILVYYIYVYFDNAARASDENSRGLLFLIRSKLSTHFKLYFPIELMKTVDLKANRNYLFASFPHGICVTGVCGNMSKMNAEFPKLFPGIQPKIATLNMFFWIPFVRELFISRDFVPCNKYVITNILSKNNDCNSSNAIAIAIGGMEELFESRPGVYCLKLLNRKGFIKIAIRTGSPIVPTFTFGEVEIFDLVRLPKNGLLQKSSFLTLCYILFKCFLMNMPKRKRLVQVVGSPIEVQKLQNPLPEYVDEIHQKVIDSLHDIFHNHKHKYLENADQAELIIK